MRRQEHFKTNLPAIKVKGNPFTPWVDKNGVFHAELEDGEVVTAFTLSELRISLSAKVEQAKTVERPQVNCYLVEYNKVSTAVYVGRRKNTSYNGYMFIINPLSERPKRENLSRHEIERKCLKPTTDLSLHAKLVMEVKKADKALEKFLKGNQFDPTKGDTIV